MLTVPRGILKGRRRQEEGAEWRIEMQLCCSADPLETPPLAGSLFLSVGVVGECTVVVILVGGVNLMANCTTTRLN